MSLKDIVKALKLEKDSLHFEEVLMQIFLSHKYLAGLLQQSFLYKMIISNILTRE